MLKELAAKLGTTVEYLWSALLKQATIEAISKTIGLMVGSILVLTILYIFLRNRTKWKEAGKDSDIDAPLILGVVLVVGSIVLLIAFFNCLPIILTGFFNPDYWALKEVTDLLHK